MYQKSGYQIKLRLWPPIEVYYPTTMVYAAKVTKNEKIM